MIEISPYIAFEGVHHIAQGTLAEVAVAAKRALDRPSDRAVLIFDAVSGEQIDLNFHGSEEDVLSRLPISLVLDDAPGGETDAPDAPRRTQGRPKLGVTAREVTLLPRHWEWLASQPGGASVALRKLVEHGMRAARKQDHARQLRDSAYRFMSAMAGNEVGFEEASRALFAANRDGFHGIIEGWPADVQEHTRRLADLFFDAEGPPPA